MSPYSENVQLALDTLALKPTVGIPTSSSNIMEHRCIERLAGTEPGSYVRDPYGVYLKMQKSIGAVKIDQYIPENPLTMGDNGYEGGGGSATTGGVATLDGLLIDSPEKAVEHMETFDFSRLKQKVEDFDEESLIQRLINEESRVQQMIGPEILKTGYAAPFPAYYYGRYGYENYFMAFALYPEVAERAFSLQADYHALYNAAIVKAYKKAGRPLVSRLDHDMADGAGTLTGIKSLERLWLPHFERAIKPLADAGFKLIWHSDGNLMELYPYLIECGVNGFQGFQYEYGMDYKKICAMKARDGSDPIIIAGVSVTCTLPFGTPDDVRKELNFLVENGPPVGLFLAMSSSCVPGTPWANIKTYVEGVQYYRQVGRKGL